MFAKVVGIDSHQVMEDLLPGHEAQLVALLSEARVRLWRVVFAEGPACARLQSKRTRRGCPTTRRDTSQ